jgi:hypothetical protein
MVHGRPFLFRIPTKDTVVVFYSTLSPQKCTKNKKKKTKPARSSAVKSDHRRGKSKSLEKRLSPTAQNHYADLEDTWDKVTIVGVIVRYTINVIGKKNEGWGHI